MTATFAAPRFCNDEAAREYLEKLRWPDGPVCPHCGVIGKAYATKRAGVYRCAEKQCRKDFSVTMNTVMERSHIALHKWLQAFHLMTSSKKGVSAHQLHRTLDITYRTAWFMAHRVREAMRTGGLGPLGGEGKIVEADETYFGSTEKPRIGVSTAPLSQSTRTPASIISGVISASRAPSLERAASATGGAMWCQRYNCVYYPIGILSRSD